MTMEEHCPHGSGNAVWCEECERDDKRAAERRRKKEAEEKRRAAEFMELAKGLPANVVAKIMRDHMRGCDYMGSPKKSMAEGYAKKGEYGTKLRDERGLKKKLKEAPRETTAAKKARARKRLVAKKVKALDTMEAVCGMSSGKMKDALEAADLEVLEAYYGFIERQRGEAKQRERNAKAAAKRLGAQALVVDKEIRRRQRRKK